MANDSPARILYDVNGNPVSVIDDSGTYRLSGVTKVLNSGGSQVDPATEGTLSTRASEATLATRASEATLIQADGRLTTIDAVLDSIKDTDGIKKITDELPAGTQEIGKVAQGTRAVAGGGWPQYVVDNAGNVVGVVLDGAVYRLQSEAQLQTKAKGTTVAAHPTSVPIDANRQALSVALVKDPAYPNDPGVDVRVVDNAGNPVGIVLDGTLYRFQTDAKVARGEGGELVHLDAIDTDPEQGRLKATLYTPEGESVALGAVASLATAIRNDFVRDGTTSPSLLVDGSTTPVVFTYDAHPTQDVSLQEVKFVLASNSITFGTDYFGATSGPLPNGLLVEITAGGVTGTVAVLYQNEDFVNFASPGGFEWVVSSKDLLASTWLVGGGLKLEAGSGDQVKITVRDDIDSAGVYFRAYVRGNLLG